MGFGKKALGGVAWGGGQNISLCAADWFLNKILMLNLCRIRTKSLKIKSRVKNYMAEICQNALSEKMRVNSLIYL